MRISIMLLIIVLSSALAASPSTENALPQKSQKSQKSNVEMSAHEINGIDRHQLNLINDDDDSDMNDNLRPVDTKNVNWSDKVRHTSEDLEWW